MGSVFLRRRTRTATVLIGAVLLAIAGTSIAMGAQSTQSATSDIFQARKRAHDALAIAQQRLQANLNQPCMKPQDAALAYQQLLNLQRAVKELDNVYNVVYDNHDYLNSGQLELNAAVILANDSIQLALAISQLAAEFNRLPGLIKAETKEIDLATGVVTDPTKIQDAVSLASTAVVQLAAIVQAIRNGAWGNSETDGLIANAFGASGAIAQLKQYAQVLPAIGGVLSVVSNAMSLYTNYQQMKLDRGALTSGLDEASRQFVDAQGRAALAMADLNRITKNCGLGAAGTIIQTQTAAMDTSSGLRFGYCNGLTCGNEFTPACRINAWIPEFPGTSTPPVLRFTAPYPYATVAQVFIQASDSTVPGSSPQTLGWIPGNNQDWNTGLLDSKPRIFSTADAVASGFNPYSSIAIPLAGSAVASSMGASFRAENGQLCGLSDQEKAAFEAAHGSYRPAFTSYVVSVVWKPADSTSTRDSSSDIAAIGIGSTGLEGAI